MRRSATITATKRQRTTFAKHATGAVSPALTGPASMHTAKYRTSIRTNALPIDFRASSTEIVLVITRIAITTIPSVHNADKHSVTISLLQSKKELAVGKLRSLYGLKYLFCLLQLLQLTFFLLQFFPHVVDFRLLLGDLVKEDLYGSLLPPRLAAALGLGCICFTVWPGGRRLTVRWQFLLSFRTHTIISPLFCFQCADLPRFPRYRRTPITRANRDRTVPT